MTDLLGGGLFRNRIAWGFYMHSCYCVSDLLYSLQCVRVVYSCFRLSVYQQINDDGDDVL